MSCRTVPAAEAFAVACKHVLADGLVDAAENDLLRRLAHDLDLPRRDALEIAQRIREAVCAEGKPRQPCADPKAIFREIVALAERRASDPPDKEVSCRPIAGVAKSLGLNFEDRPQHLPLRIVDNSAVAVDDGLVEAAELPTISWTRWPVRIWSRPLFTVGRLLDGASPYRKAWAIRRRISRLVRRGPSAGLLESVVARVNTAAEILWEIDDELDQLVAYLSRRGLLTPTPPRHSSRQATAIDAMHSRRMKLSTALAEVIGELERLEDRVAAYVLARPDGLPRRLESELQQALADLDIVASVIR